MTLADTAYASLRQDIVTGALPPGRSLRMEALRDRYGIGFSPLREALNRLRSERLVLASPLRGFTVAPISLAAMWDVIETRILVETRALALSIEHGEDGWEGEVVATLHALSLQARRVDGSADPPLAERHRLEERHGAFHRALIGACGSDWLLDFAAKLYAASERYRWVTLVPAPDKGAQRSLDAEHRALADAATERDGPRAKDLLARHYRATGRALEARMSAGPAQSAQPEPT